SQGLAARVSQHCTVAVRRRSWKQLRDLRQLGCEKDRDIGEQYADKVEAEVFPVAPLLARHFPQLTDADLRKSDSQVRSEPFIVGDVGKGSRRYGRRMQCRKVIAFQVTVIGNFP